MMSIVSRFSLVLRGTFRLCAPGGEHIKLSSKKGIALIAMLATAHDGERTRIWLQDHLWGKRRNQEAQGSLRRELLTLRRLLNRQPAPLLICKRDRVQLNFELIDVDIHDMTSSSAEAASGEFLEGIGIAGEKGFEDWIREHRAASGSSGLLEFNDFRVKAAALQPTLSVLRTAVDTSPHDGFGDRPALAVLPFANLTGDVANGYISEGISDDLVERLARLRWLPVISPASTYTVSARETDRSIVSQQLQARYLLEGRLRNLHGGFSLSVSLTEAPTDLMLWSQRIPIPFPCSLDLIEQATTGLVSVLDARIDHAEQSRAHTKPRSSLDVRDLIWRGRWHLNRFSRDDAEKAAKLFAKALLLEPDSPEALIQAAFCLSWSNWAARRSDAKIVEMRELAQRAIAADVDDGRGHMLAGMAEMWLRKPVQAAALLHKAIELNPSLALAHAELGSCHIMQGQPQFALGCLELAMRLSPNDVHAFYPLGEIAMAHCMLHHWRDAIEFADRALTGRAGYWYAQMIKVVAFAEMGDASIAAEAYEELISMQPGFSRGHVEWLPFVDRKWIDYFHGVVSAVADDAISASGSRVSHAPL